MRDLTLDTIYSHPSAIQCNASSEIESLKSSVSSGKQQVANAITGKGVSASGNDSFATLASKIASLSTSNSTEQSVYSGVRVFTAPNGMYDYSDGLKLISGPNTIYYGGTSYAQFQTSYGYVHTNRYTKLTWQDSRWAPVMVALDPIFNLKSETFTFSINEANSNLPPICQIVSVSRQNNHMQISMNIGLSGSECYWDSGKTDQTTKLITVQTLGTIFVRFTLDTDLYISY